MHNRISISIALGVLLLIVGGCTVKPQAKRYYPEGSGRVVVEMIDFNTDNGQAVVSLFGAAKGFPDAIGTEVRSLTAPIIDGRSMVVFTEVNWGEYAISAFHDQDSDGRMNSNFLGIPKEGHGSSSNLQSLYGPPDFDQSSFILLAAERIVQIKMQYQQRRGLGSRKR